MSNAQTALLKFSNSPRKDRELVRIVTIGGSDRDSATPLSYMYALPYPAVST